MIIQKNYEVGYINGYLAGLLEFYNLRHRQKNDFRLTHAFFIKTVATGDLEEDIITSLKEFHYHLSSVRHMDRQQLKKSLDIRPLQIPINGLAKYVEPWLPIKEQKEMADRHHPGSFTPVLDNLMENVLDHVIKDYGLLGENYVFWQADTQEISKLFFDSIDEAQAIVFENDTNVCVLHFVREFLHS